MCFVICKPLVLTFSFIATKLSAWKDSISRVNVHVLCQDLLAGDLRSHCYIILMCSFAHLDKARGPRSLCPHLTSSDNNRCWELVPWVSLCLTFTSLLSSSGWATGSLWAPWVVQGLCLTHPHTPGPGTQNADWTTTETGVSAQISSPPGPLSCL